MRKTTTNTVPSSISLPRSPAMFGAASVRQNGRGSVATNPAAPAPRVASATAVAASTTSKGPTSAPTTHAPSQRAAIGAPMAKSGTTHRIIGHLLAPNDPEYVAGTQPLMNVVETSANYLCAQNDGVVIVQGSVTITLRTDHTIVGFPVKIVADSGTVVVAGPIQGGDVTINQGHFVDFSFSPISEEWSYNQGSSSPGVETTTIVNHATGPYTAPAYNNAMVDTSSGTISEITLGTGVLGSTFEVSDYGQDASTNNITIAPASGCQLEDPNNPGVYALPNATCVFATNGQFCRWRFDGTSKYKIVATGT